MEYNRNTLRIQAQYHTIYRIIFLPFQIHFISFEFK